jgi:drug/metabolite transporter (DMT)-like permease
MNQKTLAYLYIIVTVVLWGLSFLSTKVALLALPPMTLGLARFAIAAVVLFFMKARFSPGKRIARRDLPLAAGAGLTGVTLYFLAENNGLKLISASECSIIIAAIPVFSMLTERIISGSPLSLVKYAGALLSVAGVWIMVSAGLSVTANVIGYLCMFGAAVSWVVYCFLTKPLFARYDRITIVYYQSLAGLVGFVPFALLEIPQWKLGSAPVWLNVVYLGIFCSALGYYFYAVGLESLGVTVCSVFLNLIPVVTVIAGFLIFGERLSASSLIGGAIVIIGVYLATIGGSLLRRRPSSKGGRG